MFLDAALKVKQASANADVLIAKIEGEKQSQMIEVNWQIEVESKKAAAEIERLRFTELTKTVVECEKTKAIVDAKAYEIRKQAGIIKIYIVTKIKMRHYLRPKRKQRVIFLKNKRRRMEFERFIWLKQRECRV